VVLVLGVPLCGFLVLKERKGIKEIKEILPQL